MPSLASTGTGRLHPSTLVVHDTHDTNSRFSVQNNIYEDPEDPES
jgi:hypothetical protein